MATLSAQKLALLRDRNAAALARLEAKLAAGAAVARARAVAKAAGPPSLKERAPEAIYVLNIQALRQAGLLHGGDWKTIERPASLPMLDRLLVARHRLQLFFAARAVPHSVEITWSRSAGFEPPTRPVRNAGSVA